MSNERCAMSPFLLGHATHPDWRMALALSAAQIDAGLVQPKQRWHLEEPKPMRRHRQRRVVVD